MKKILLVCLILIASASYSKAEVVYVDAARPDNNGDGTSWATAKKNLWLALWQAQSGQQIWVKAGTYKPSTDNNVVSFEMRNGVELYGGFNGTETMLSQRNEKINVTILSGDLLDDDGPGYSSTGFNSDRIISNTNLNSTAVLDGFTVRGGSAYNGLGTGMRNLSSSPTIRNVIFMGNNTISIGGAVYNSGGSPTFINCVFYKNSGAAGSAMYNEDSSPSIVNCVFAENSSSGSGTIFISGQSGSTPTKIINSTIVSNHHTSGFAGVVASKTEVIIQNCIFDSNDLSDGSYNSDLSSEWSAVSVSYSIFSDGHPGKGIIKGSVQSPEFIDVSDPDGPDNLWRTADDGLRLQCSSSAINTGINDYCGVTIPITDILGLARTVNADMGAYEGGFADQAVNAIAAASTTILFDQNVTGTTNYATCDKLVASLSSSDAYTVAGSVTAKVWIETAQPANYVKRHYEITPASNASTATGKVTLYFTQQEFDDFNDGNSTKLPTGSGDTEGIGNLRIEKRSGTSSDGTGLPGTYPTGTPETFAPSAANGSVVWNGTASRWEVTFEVIGFSGFFVKTLEAALPLRLMAFSGTQESSTNKLQWQTANEVNTKSFELESSKDGRNFLKVATIDAVSEGDNNYNYTDRDISKGIVYYRLKMIDIDGKFTYSRILSLSRDGKGDINLYPNPVADLLHLSLDTKLINSEASLYNKSGRLLQTIRITSGDQPLNVKTLPTGFYIIKFKDGSTGSFVKE